MTIAVFRRISWVLLIFIVGVGKGIFLLADYNMHA